MIQILSKITYTIFFDTKLKVNNYCSGKNAFVKIIHLNKATK